MRNKRFSIFLTFTALLSLFIVSHVQADMWVSRPLDGLVGDTFKKDGYRIVPGDDPKKSKYRIKFVEDEKKKSKGVGRYGSKKKEAPLTTKLPPPNVGGNMVGDFFGHELNYQAYRGDPAFCAIVYQYLRLGKSAGLTDADMKHQIAIRGIHTMSMTLGFVQSGEGGSAKIVKMYDHLLKRKKGNLPFVDWYKKEKDAIPAKTVAEGLQSDFDSIALKAMIDVVNEGRKIIRAENVLGGERQRHRDNLIKQEEREALWDKAKVGKSPELIKRMEERAVKIRAVTEKQNDAIRIKLNNQEAALKKTKRGFDATIKTIIDISHDKNRSLLVRVQAGICLKEISPRECLTWCLEFFNDKEELLAYHACWLARAYGGPPIRIMQKMKHKGAAFKHIVWAAVLKGEAKYIKAVLAIPGKDPNTKLYKNALNACLGKPGDISKIVKHMEGIMNKVSNKAFEGDLNVYGPVPLILLIQAITQIPKAKERRKAFAKIFVAGRKYAETQGMAPDGAMMSYYCYGIFNKITKEEQEDLIKWKKDNPTLVRNPALIDIVIAKKLDDKKKK
jgi:hypothetical protein